jgi:hypothetical protein
MPEEFFFFIQNPVILLDYVLVVIRTTEAPGRSSPKGRRLPPGLWVLSS